MNKALGLASVCTLFSVATGFNTLWLNHWLLAANNPRLSTTYQASESSSDEDPSYRALKRSTSVFYDDVTEPLKGVIRKAPLVNLELNSDDGERSDMSTRPRVVNKVKLNDEDQLVHSLKKEDTRTTGLALSYESAIIALQCYRQIHGDLVMPRKYVVPSVADFPRDWHGIDLSGTVYDIKWWRKNVKEKPQRVSELNSLGFVWERLQPEWNLVLEALVTYLSLHSHVMVPVKFVVPNESPWPKATWGIRLGNCVYRIRTRNDFLGGTNAYSRRDQLERLGFVWDVHEQRFIKFLGALRHFASLEKCGKFSDSSQLKALKVPSRFVVPTDSRWPKELWGYPLGEKCIAVRQKQLYVKNKKHRQQLLEELGFRWSGNADLGWLQVVHAAAIYSRIHGRNLDVPFHYVVPSPPLDSTPAEKDEWPWPEHLWGLPLGQRLKDVRNTGSYLKGKNADSRRRQLDALGFNWTPRRGRPKKGL